MTQLGRRLFLLERRAARRPTLSDRAVRDALARLSLEELEALESALVAREAGRPLDDVQRAAFDAWERVAPHDAT